MNDKADKPQPKSKDGSLDPAARRALAEAAARRKAMQGSVQKTLLEKETGGRKDISDGLEPTRYGDWEKNGIAVDF